MPDDRPSLQLSYRKYEGVQRLISLLVGVSMDESGWREKHSGMAAKTGIGEVEFAQTFWPVTETREHNLDEFACAGSGSGIIAQALGVAAIAVMREMRVAEARLRRAVRGDEPAV